MNNNAGVRAQFRILAAALWGAVTVTLVVLAPDFPEGLIVAWGSLYMAVVGFGEAWYDSRKPPAPVPPVLPPGEIV